VIGRIHEHLYVDRFASFIERITNHLSHLDAAVIDWRANIEIAQVGSPQRKACTRSLAGDFRRYLKSLEFIGGLLPLRGHRRCVNRDIYTRQQRTKSGHTTECQARTYDPETGFRLRDVFGAVTVQLGCDKRRALLVVHLEAGDHADRDVLVAHTCLAYFDAFGRLERDGDAGAGGHPIAHHERDAHQHSHQGHQPYPRNAALLAWMRLRFRYCSPRLRSLLFYFRSVLFIHGLSFQRWSSVRDPTRSADHSSGRPTWSAPPPDQSSPPRGRR